MAIEIGPAEQSVLLTSYDGQGDVRIELKNPSAGDVVLRGGAIVSEETVSADGSSTLYVRFGGEISPPSPEDVTVSADAGTWGVEYFGDGFPVWAFAPQADVPLGPGATVTLTLSNLSPRGRPRPAQAGIDYYNFPDTDDGMTQIVLSLERPPSKKLRRPPVALGVVSSTKRVFTTTDERAPIRNEVQVFIRNKEEHPLVPDDVTWDAEDPPRLTLWFVLAEPPGYGALTTVHRAAHVEASLLYEGGERWELTPRLAPETPEGQQGSLSCWELTPRRSNRNLLAPGAKIEVKLSNLVTDLPVGEDVDVTPVYLQVSNLPTFNDALFSSVLEKEEGPVITEFRVDPAGPPPGEPSHSAEVTWATKNADGVELSGLGTELTASGSVARVVRPRDRLVLTARREGSDWATVSRTVVVLGPARETLRLGISEAATVAAPGKAAAIALQANRSGDPGFATKGALVDLATRQAHAFDLGPLVNPGYVRELEALDRDRATALAENDKARDDKVSETRKNMGQMFAMNKAMMMTAQGRENAQHMLAEVIEKVEDDYAKLRAKIEGSFETKRRELAQRCTGTGVEAVAVAPEGAAVYAAVAVHDPTGARLGSVAAIEPDDGSPRIVADLGPMASQSPPAKWGLAPAGDGRTLWFSSAEGLVTIDLGTSAVRARHAWPAEWVTALGAPSLSACSRDGTKVLLIGSGGLLIADVRDGLTELGRISAGDVDPAFALTGAAAVDEELHRIYAIGATPDRGQLLVVDVEPGTYAPTLDRSIPVPPQRASIALAAGGEMLFASFETNPPILKIVDTQTFDVRSLQWAPAGYSCRSLVASKFERNVLYSTAGDDFTTTVIDEL